MAQKRTPKKSEADPVAEPPATARPAKRTPRGPSEAPPTSPQPKPVEAAPFDGAAVLASLDAGRSASERRSFRSLWGVVAAFGGAMTAAAFDALADDEDEEAFGAEARAALTKAGLLSKKVARLTMSADAVAFALAAMRRGEHGFDRSMLEVALEYVLEIADEGTLMGAEEAAVAQLAEELPMVLSVGLALAADREFSADSIVELVQTLHPHAARYPALLPMWKALSARLVIRPVAAGRAFHASGQLELARGAIPEARALYKRALEVLLRANDLVTASLVHRSAGELEARLGNHRRAKALYRRAMKGSGPDVRNAEGESTDGAPNALALGDLELRLGRAARAQRAFVRARELAERERDEAGLAAALSGLGDALLHQGELADARVTLERASAAFEALEDVARAAHVAASLAIVDHVEGDLKGAKARLAKAKALAKELADPRLVAHLARVESNFAAGA